MRKYQPLWEQIKVNSTIPVTIVAELSLHARIIQAVRKEKAADAGWKYQQQEQGIKLKLKETVEGIKITFYLEKDTSLYLNSL